MDDLGQAALHRGVALRRLAYVSQVDVQIAPTDLRHIAGMAELLHRRHNLSGVLAFSGRHFFQVIEGTDSDVEDLLNLIRADNRHDRMRILCDETVHCRIFDRWTSCIVDSLDLADRIEHAHSQSAERLTVTTLMEDVARPDMSHELTSTWAALNR